MLAVLSLLLEDIMVGQSCVDGGATWDGGGAEG
jgi:hypothetical protein